MQETDERGTPLEIFRPLHDLFDFTLDPCAMRGRPLYELPEWRFKEYFIEDNGLSKNWTGEKCFVNPPYSRGSISDWVKKMSEEAAKGTFICALVRQDCSTEWYRTIKRISWHIEEIPYRVSFAGAKQSSKPFWSSVIMLMGGPFPLRKQCKS